MTLWYENGIERDLRPQDFLELVHRSRRGRLKLYIGFAAGVGKTYRMLEEAHALRKRGTDIVLALIEPHGRAETRALIEGLEAVPLRRTEYRGVTVEEMDLDAVLARRPEIAIVDEIAHTNVPDSRNRKRYQDVLDLLEAGIHVLGAFNIQHLESLNDVVARVTGVTVRETVPDSFLHQADQVVNLDLSAEDLVDRLKSGKIYPDDRVPWALEHFFKSENLSMLREIALRQVAESVERAGMTAQPGEPRQAADRSREAVCIASMPPRALALMRRGARIAGRLQTRWYVIFVETPSESPSRIESEAQRHLIANQDKAREMGAEFVRIQARDPVKAVLDFARSNNVGQLIIGRSNQPWWKQVLGRAFPMRVVREATDVDIQIVSMDKESPP